MIAIVSIRGGGTNKRAALILQKALAAVSTSYQVGSDGIQIQKKIYRKSNQVSHLRRAKGGRQAVFEVWISVAELINYPLPPRV